MTPPPSVPKKLQQPAKTILPTGASAEPTDSRRKVNRCAQPIFPFRNGMQQSQSIKRFRYGRKPPASRTSFVMSVIEYFSCWEQGRKCFPRSGGQTRSFPPVVTSAVFTSSPPVELIVLPIK